MAFDVCSATTETLSRTNKFLLVVAFVIHNRDIFSFNLLNPTFSDR